MEESTAPILDRKILAAVWIPWAVSTVGIGLLFALSVWLAKLNGASLSNNAAAQFTAFKLFVVHHFNTPYFPIFFGFVLLLEWLKPAQVRGGILSKGFAYDASIGLIVIAFQFIIVGVVMYVLFSLYAQVRPPLLGLATSKWSNWGRAAFGLAIGDFLSWASHWVRHKVPSLWRFHAMHHSQTQLNIFTEFRNHPFDSLLSSVMQSLPLYLMQIPFEISATFLVCYKYYLMFTHANVDLDYGWGSYLLVSPRFHRVHHAIAPELHDHNFGAVLSIWDVIFGTSKGGLSEAPTTGADDFPSEHDAPLRRGWLTYLRQLAAPFRASDSFSPGRAGERAKGKVTDGEGVLISSRFQQQSCLGPPPQTAVGLDGDGSALQHGLKDLGAEVGVVDQ